MAKNGTSVGDRLTPMMRQYHDMRQKLPSDVLLLFRLGDFYEMFFDDAKRAADILNLTLTKRNGIPMAGVPHHAVQGYVARLVRAGCRIALAEQTEEPRPGKLVSREISQVLSAGTVLDDRLLDPGRPNYVAALLPEGEDGGRFGLAWADLTTGEFRLGEFPGHAIADAMARVGAVEWLYPTGVELPDEVARQAGGQAVEAYTFLADHAAYLIKERFRVQSLDGFGCAGAFLAVGAAGALLHYVEQDMKWSLEHLRPPRLEGEAGRVVIDRTTQESLELVDSRGGRQHTLLGAIDGTRTPMGARTLRDWILHPITALDELEARQGMIGGLLEDVAVLEEVRERLGEVRDLSRTVTRLSRGTGNGRDLRALGRALEQIPGLRGLLCGLTGIRLAAEMAGGLADFRGLAELIDAALVDEPPANLKDGGLFRAGHHGELDELRRAATEGRRWIAELQAGEIKRTGIKSLKVKYNAVFGYFLEVTKSNLALVPDDWTRKQTTANAERYITPELKEMENKILGADERAKTLEAELFLELRGIVMERLGELQAAAEVLAVLDVLGGLAEVARRHDYVCPLLNESRNLYIRGGRHPVLERDRLTGGGEFVPNDTTLDGGRNRLILLTGPNMAGKSTYIRQVALIALMAQIGSWVPAEAAEIGLVDRIFTRVGASDDLTRGQSTFMVEMNETALIVNNATERSLIVLDEIGRGTSTFDGLSIAWSVAEHLHDSIAARTLFATHYHELTALAGARNGVQNYNVAVREWNEQIIFLRKIVAGAADKSYGIQVARLAGLPGSVIHRAKEILGQLEGGDNRPGRVSEDRQGVVRRARRPSEVGGATPELPLFD